MDGLELGFKCPICSKSVASDEMEMHFIMCLSKPRLSYNDDVLTKDAGECVICLEELLQGDTIARLPCLCIYHKRYGAKKALLSSLAEEILTLCKVIPKSILIPPTQTSPGAHLDDWGGTGPVTTG
ncbi:hypothetical protein lerEdw1_001096 [Lerista edwardsae]|nr:hypothetical protein lerEdw1_001096 [Lerista edwardsae]